MKLLEEACRHPAAADVVLALQSIEKKLAMQKLAQENPGRIRGLSSWSLASPAKPRRVCRPRKGVKLSESGERHATGAP